jgi:hypothetical protein
VITVINIYLWLITTAERCAATDTQAITTLAWAQAIATTPELLAIAPSTIPMVVAPAQGWQGWMTSKLPHALLLPSVTDAIAASTDQGNRPYSSKNSQACSVPSKNKLLIDIRCI